MLRLKRKKPAKPGKPEPSHLDIHQARLIMEKLTLPSDTRRRVIAPVAARQDLGADDIEIWARHASSRNGFGE